MDHWVLQPQCPSNITSTKSKSICKPIKRKNQNAFKNITPLHTQCLEDNIVPILPNHPNNGQNYGLQRFLLIYSQRRRSFPCKNLSIIRKKMEMKIEPFNDLLPYFISRITTNKNMIILFHMQGTRRNNTVDKSIPLSTKFTLSGRSIQKSSLNKNIYLYWNQIPPSSTNNPFLKYKAINMAPSTTN